MAITLTIGGVSKTWRAGSLQISAAKNGRATASFEVVSTDATYRPALDAAVVIADVGVTKFGGLVNAPAESGVFGDAQGNNVEITTRVTAVDYNAYAERRYVNETIPAGTLKAALTTLVANYLTGYGVTLDAGQVTGPTLPELVYEYRPLVDVLNELSTLTAKYGNPYVWGISATKVLSMSQPSSVAAPFNVVDGDGHAIGDLTVEQSRNQYANKIIVKVPPITEIYRTETFTGDGVTTAFTLTYTLVRGYGYVTNAGVFETLHYTGDGGTATWTYDPATNTITRSSAPANLAAISINFDGTYQAIVTAQDAAEIASYGICERLIVLQEAPTNTTLQALADAELAVAKTTPKTIRYRTRTAGLAVGQSQTITSTLRNLSTSAIITELVTHDVAGIELQYDVTLDTGVVPKDGWREVYQTWSGDKSGAGSGVSVTTGGGPASGGPGGPDKAVQYNAAGVFGGEAQFTYNPTTDSLVCGGGGSSITAAVPDSCQVFGYNCHIADA